MIEEKVLKLLEGQFDNRIQALSNPSRFAYIRVTHTSIGNAKLYGEQAYNYKLDKPYRQFVIEPVREGNRVAILNYELEDKEQYVGGKNLDKIKNYMLSLKQGCTLYLEEKGPNIFEGEIEGDKCLIEWGGQTTFLQTKIRLTDTHYYVLDRGYDVNNPKKQIWGTKNGMFEFVRKTPL